jgi:hypothetical protein
LKEELEFVMDLVRLLADGVGVVTEDPNRQAACEYHVHADGEVCHLKER